MASEMTKEKRLEYTEPAREILGQMSLEEKVALMSGDTTLQMTVDDKKKGFHFNYFPFKAGGNARLHVPPLMFCDGPRGVVCGEGKATCFPVPMLRGATFDLELEEQIGHAIGREVRAFGGNFFGGICINLPWHPGWGRSQEVYGEDSFALASFGAAAVRGVQGEYVVACLKHYAFNSMEDSRFEVDVECDRRTEQEVFLPHFKGCIDAGAAGVMTAYNKYRGELCGQSAYLISHVLKEEWGFDGIVMSDFFWGIQDTEKAALAGTDLEMCHTRCYGKSLVTAVKKGLVPEGRLEDSALRIVRTLTAFEREYEKSGKHYGKEVPGCAAHRKLALKAAQEGITLIKNEGRVLPLSRKLKQIAVIGRLAARENTGDNGSSKVYPDYVVTPLEGIVKEAPEAEIVYYDGSDLGHIRRLARESGAVIFVVGLDYRDEGEYNPLKKNYGERAPLGGDRKSLGLNPEEARMLKEAGRENPSTVAVLMGGSAITISEWEESVPAILYAYYPGQEGGTALAQILFGKVNPSGKLPFVLPKEERDLPGMDWEAANWRFGYYHGYRYLDKRGTKPCRPYGFGLSYTTFDLKDPVFSVAGEEITASVLVKNTGGRKGTEVVQMYVGFSASAIDRPVKALCGFLRAALYPGEEKRVAITCPTERLKYYDCETETFMLEHMEYDVYIGTSSAIGDLHKGNVRI